ncbi:sulfatase family protein [Vallitalea sp.]|jgi:arylsulfatase A-like enzyme|uniref:sulfatase family protein n=1 Tax=Vallitalea sp. TaxID=1882829 RepID=UPI0025FCC8E6|nr:sulfatase [Vallitalea sp.]MCT4688830.1 sulfatase [Vallitalea sp.]
MKKKKPNILYIFADQWRRQAMGFMKEDEVITPNMDKFAKESMVFDNAISCCPLCSPQRSTLMTGKYPINTGVFTNCKRGLDIRLKDEEICIGDVLKQEDYHTGYIGKWHLDEPELNHCKNPLSGADGWDAFTPPGERRHGFDFWYSYGAKDKHLSPHYWKNDCNKIHINKWSPEHETDIAIEYIKEKYDSEDPFALFISWNPPHSPYDAVPDKYKDIYKDKKINFRKNVITDNIICHTYEQWGSGLEKIEEATKDYYAAITGLDENFGRLLEVLNELKIADDTIIVLTADHGDLMGSHGMIAKHVWYEESIGVPFILRWNNHIPKGRESRIINSVDIMPTLLGLINIPIPNTVEGVDISPNIIGTGNVEVPSALIHAYPGRDVFLEAYREKGLNPLSKGWRGLRTQKYTYVVYKGYWPDDEIDVRYLYDLEKDPYQLSPIEIKDINNNELALKFEKELKKRLDALGDPFEF